MRGKVILSLLGILILSFLTLSLYPGKAEETNIIKVGLVWSQEDPGFFEAARLAVEEVNQKGILITEGEEEKLFFLEPVFCYEDFSLSTAEAVKHSKKLARKLATDSGVVAVIGHYTSDTALPASLIYETGNKLFLATGATVPSLTEHGFKKVFRMIPSDRDIAHNISSFIEENFFASEVPEILSDKEFLRIQTRFASLRTEHRVLIKNSYEPADDSYYLKESVSAQDKEVLARLFSYVLRERYGIIIREQSVYGKSLASEITAHAGLEYIHLRPSLTYFPHKKEFHKILSSLRLEPVHAVIFSGQYQGAEAFIKSAEKSGFKLPVILGDITPEEKEYNFPLYYTDFYSEKIQTPAGEKFRDRMKVGGIAPGLSAVKAWESIMLFAEVLRESGSKNPDHLAGFLRYREPWQGVSQDIAFEESGNLKNPVVYIKKAGSSPEE